MSSKMFDGNDLPHELLLTTQQKTKLRNAFNNNMQTDKLSKAQISRIIPSGRFLVSLLSKIAGPLMKVAVPLVKYILVPLGITAAASTIDAGIQKKKKNTQLWDNNFSNFKWRNDWHNRNCSSSWRF